MLINQQIENKSVANPIAALPSVSTTDLVELMRIDKTMGNDRISSYITDAYDIINTQLPVCEVLDIATIQPEIGTCVWETAPTLYSHHHRLDCNPPQTSPVDALTIVQQPRWRRTYIRAVLHEAAALFAENYADFDTIGQGITRGINQHSKSDSLRRIVSHCIADLTARRRNRMTLL